MYGDCDDGCNCMQWIPLLSALIIVEDNIVESLVIIIIDSDIIAALVLPHFQIYNNNIVRDSKGTL